MRSRNQHAARTVATLKGLPGQQLLAQTVITKRTLQPLGGDNGASLCLHSKNQARRQGLAIDEHHAGAAYAFATTIADIAKPQSVMQARLQSKRRLDFGLPILAIHSQRDFQQLVCGVHRFNISERVSRTPAAMSRRRYSGEGGAGKSQMASWEAVLAASSTKRSFHSSDERPTSSRSVWPSRCACAETPPTTTLDAEMTPARMCRQDATLAKVMHAEARQPNLRKPEVAS